MKKEYIYQPVAKGTPKVDKIEVFAELIPKGKENAIKRDDLTQKCVEAGLIGADVVDKDRAMRTILGRAKMDYNITNDGDGSGYYRPTKGDAVRLARNNNRERKKGISTINGDKLNRALVEDYNHGRITGDA